jgi:hypothetical protein
VLRLTILAAVHQKIIVEKENRFTMSLRLVALVAEDSEERQKYVYPPARHEK